MSRSLIQEKISQAVSILGEMNVDCWLTFVRETSMMPDPVLPFLVHADLTWHSAIILTPTGEKIALVGKYDRQTIVDSGAFTEVIDYVEGFRKPLQEIVRRLNPKTIALNYSPDSEIADGLTHGMFLTLQETLREIGMDGRVMSSEQIISALRQRKTETELHFIRRAIGQAEEIFALVAKHIRPGMSEEAIARFMQEETVRRGLSFAWDSATCPAVFTGPDTANAHYSPTNRCVAPGHILNMDFGVKVDEYCSDLQRTFFVLRPGEVIAPAVVLRGFETITQSIELARAQMKPGAQGIDADTAARKCIVDAGYPEFPHALGHQVGRFAHDGTALLGPKWEKYGKKPFQKLEEGMVFTIEPRLTVPGYGVVTIENMIVVRATGAEYLSTPQTQLLYIYP
jgi:Xaa-Pro aminopeptidase